MTGASDARVAGRRVRLLEELERIRRTLASDPDVLQLTVFGFLTSAAVHEWSDLDLAVVMRTGLGFVDRALELRRRLGPQVGVDLLVYSWSPARTRSATSGRSSRRRPGTCWFP